jgi:hypothetical protein
MFIRLECDPNVLQSAIQPPRHAIIARRLIVSVPLRRNMLAPIPRTHLSTQRVFGAARQGCHYSLQQTCMSLLSFMLPSTLTPFQIRTVFQDRLSSALTTLEKHLVTCTYLAMECITLPDIMLATKLQSAFSTTFDAALRAKLPNVVRHFETIVTQPNLASILGSTTHAEKVVHTTPEGGGACHAHTTQSREEAREGS